ncbi:hypothetical protein B0H19DRAFT_1137983 [Mycena capillaripes]|nr:hypothetical protein B0H19DRAFT_1162317 [Mycena capillaripes]KAJ6564291.1 hypothetical protein B0H19DRAFT_1140725 [Mycena capillaripes]KAJ6566500.1 hypothetical protein B0H19DRAFT_1137983 [Mycena capillaripes]
MLKNHKNLELIQSIARQMNLGIEGARSDDTGTLKPRILSLLDEKPAPDAKIVMTTGSSKATRATDPAVAALLLPLEYKYDPAHPDPWASIAAGDLDLNSRQLPCFLFPFGQANDDSALDTILHGPVMLRCGKAVYMGPSSALQGDGFHQGRAGIASIIGLRSFTDRVIAGLACQVRFNLSSMQAWNRHDGNFDYEEFFWCIVDLFKNPEFAANTIALYNR